MKGESGSGHDRASPPTAGITNGMADSDAVLMWRKHMRQGKENKGDEVGTGGVLSVPVSGHNS